MPSERIGRENLKCPVTDTVSISNHAALRFSQRCDPAEAFPRQRIRQIVDHGRWVNIIGFEDPAKMLDGIAAVVDRGAEEVVTVLRPRKGQLKGETDASAGWKAEYHHQGVGARGH